MLDPIVQSVIAHLDGLGTDYEMYEMIDCDPDLADTAAFCAHYGYPPEKAANTIVVASRKPAGVHAACVVLATTRLDVNHKVRELLGVKKLSFAPAETTKELTGMLIGGVTPFALPETMPLFVDARIMDLDWAIFGAGSRSAKIKASPEVFDRLHHAQIVEDLALET
ncbi:MAG TPA: hypothetical protein ENG94_06645 [Actinobacteria bacterium]|nr:hypothetical protein [Actinomycetota bacterium]